MRHLYILRQQWKCVFDLDVKNLQLSYEDKNQLLLDLIPWKEGDGLGVKNDDRHLNSKRLYCIFQERQRTKKTEINEIIDVSN